MTGVLIRECILGGKEGVHVYCEDGMVARVSESPVDPPAGTEVIEANGGALYPGFVIRTATPSSTVG